MNWQGLSFILPLLLSGAISLGTAIYIVYKRALPNATGFFMVGLMGAIWSLAYFLEITSPDLDSKILWANVKSIGMVVLPAGVLILSLEYAQRRKWLSPVVHIILWAWAVIMMLLIWMDGSNEIYRPNLSVISFGPWSFLGFDHSPMYWIQMAYSYLLVAGGMFIMIHGLQSLPAVNRREGLALVLAVGIPWVVHGTYLIAHSSEGFYDITPVFLGLGSLLMAWTIYHHRILDIVPYALRVMADLMMGGVIVTDGDRNIITINPAALNIFNAKPDEVIGTPVENLPGLASIELNDEPYIEESIIKSHGRSHFFELRSSPLRDRTKMSIGWLIILNDITEQKHEEISTQEDEQVTQTILKIGAELAKSLDFNQVLDLTLEQVRPIVPYDAASVMLVEGGYARPSRERGFEPYGDEGIKLLHELKLEIVKVANLRQMAETRKPLFIADTSLNPDWVDFGVEEQFHSWVGAPIITGDRLIAFLSLNKAEPNYYTNEDASHLAIFANQVSLALDNARLYSEAQQRITELSILNEIGQTLSSYLELDELLQKVHQQVGRLFDASNFMVAVHENEANEWVAVYLVDQSNFNLSLHRKVSEGLTGYIIQKRQPLVFNSLDELLVFEAQSGVKSIGKDPQSWMGVPLISADKVVGAMAIEHFEKQNLYGEKELALFSTIGATVATAIENARLYKDMQMRTVELAESNKATLEARTLSDALRQAGEALSTTLDFEQVLDMVLEQIKLIVPHDAANIYLIEGKDVKPVRLGGYESYTATMVKRVADISMKIDETPNIRHLLEIKRPLVIPDTDKYPGWIKAKTYDRIGSWVGAPLIARDQVMGVISLIKINKDGFTREHADILGIFAGQAALAMENARLFEEVQRFAITDALSGLYNRAYFSEQLNRLEQGRHYPVSILIADIDNLKETNDTYGHQVGDELIRQSARLFSSSVRVEDTVARIGGDEFAVLLPDTDAEKAKQIMERLHDKMHAINSKKPEPPLRLSMGIATGNSDRPLSEVLKEADRLMYLNKKNRRNEEKGD